MKLTNALVIASILSMSGYAFAQSPTEPSTPPSAEVNQDRQEVKGDNNAVK